MFFLVNFLSKDLKSISGLIFFSLLIAVEDLFFLRSFVEKIIWRLRLDISISSLSMIAILPIPSAAK